MKSFRRLSWRFLCTISSAFQSDSNDYWALKNRRHLLSTSCLSSSWTSVLTPHHIVFRAYVTSQMTLWGKWIRSVALAAQAQMLYVILYFMPSILKVSLTIIYIYTHTLHTSYTHTHIHTHVFISQHKRCLILRVCVQFAGRSCYHARDCG
jgi:hypothetical protein